MGNTYLVTRGSYEDYTIIASFGTDEEAAKAFVARLRSEDDDEDDEDDLSFDAVRIETLPVRPAGWFGTEEDRAVTYLDARTGKVLPELGSRETEHRIEHNSLGTRHYVREQYCGRRQLVLISIGPEGTVFDAHDALVELAKEKLRPHLCTNIGTINRHPVVDELRAELGI